MESHRFGVGSMDCLLVLDGTHDYAKPGESFFCNAPRDELRAYLKGRGQDPDNWPVYVSPYPALVVFAGNEKVLIDTGAGSFDKTTGHLLPRLRAAGVEPDRIDTVVITHGHVDHLGGCLDAADAPAFPNARYLIDRREWEFWTTTACEGRSSAKLIELARKQLLPLADRFVLSDGETEVAPGVRLLPAYGHTPGHLCVEVASDGQRLVYISDLALLPHHLEKPQWFYPAEVDQAMCLETRLRLYRWMADQHALVQAFHFDFPGLGYIVPSGNAWRWEPAA